MTNEVIQLDHIALHVTNLERSIRFYQDILHMQVCSQVNLGTLSPGGRLVGRAVSGGQGLLKGLIGGLSSRAIRDQYTDIALLSTNGRNMDILLVEERYPDTNESKSVHGETIFGFSCTLAPSVNTEILGWDLHQAGATFVYGNPGLDGTIFSQDCPLHSIYVQDPDGRMIELKPGQGEECPDSFIQTLDSITLHVTYPDKSKLFYTEELDLIIDSDSQSTIPGKRFIWLKDKSGNKYILLFGRIMPNGNPGIAGGFGLDHFALTGCTCHGEKSSPVTDIRMDADRFHEKTQSTYTHDVDGHWIECFEKN